MTNTFLVAVDGSEGSNRAVEYAADSALRGKAKLVLAYVIEWTPYSFHTAEELAERHGRREEEIERAQTKMLKPLADALKAKGVDIEQVVRHGHISETLAAIASETGATQIFIGRKGESRVASLLFGSVSASLVQTSPVPVTVVP